MAQTYLLFDFGSDEEKAQQARHKLEGWKQAFRLDKKLLYKLDREDTGDAQSDAADEPSAKTAKSSAKSAKSSKGGAKTKSKSKQKAADEEDSSSSAKSDGKVGLLVRLYFSGHEKLTEQRWIERIPSEEPFKEASPQIVRQGEPQFDELVAQFDSLE